MKNYKFKTAFALVVIVITGFAFRGPEKDISSSSKPDVAFPATKNLPNIIIILADDLGYGDVGCYHPASKIPTPNLDKMAMEGMRFTDAHSPAAVCTPTRLSLMTGRYPFRFPNGGQVFSGVGGPCKIEEGRLTLPQMLKNKGYTTACVGKWHIGMTFYDKDGQPIRADTHGNGLEAVKQVDYTRRIEGGPVDRGFDSFFGTACCPTTDWLYAYINDDRIPNPPDKQIDKSTLPQQFYGLDCRPGMQASDFDLEEVDLVFLKKSKEFLRNHVKKDPKKPFFLYHAMQAVHLPSFPADQFKGKSGSGPHGDFIFEMDFVVGELMKTLKELGVDDNTIVLFSSDNGVETPTIWHMRKTYDHDGSYPWRGAKRDTWEGGHRVPLIARWPDHIKPNTVTEQTISLVDIMGTIASVVDFELPDDAAEDSFDFKDVLLGQAKEEPVRKYTYQLAKGLSIRRGPWKFINHPYEIKRSDQWIQSYLLPDKAPGSKAQLYNLEQDPGETTNLYFEYPEIVKELSEQLDANLKQGRSRVVN